MHLPQHILTEKLGKMKPHAIMISTQGQGHINAFVSLALKLASKGFAITFVHLEFVHHRLSNTHNSNTSEVDFFSEARESGLDIRYMTISDGLPLEFDRDLRREEYWDIIIRDFPARVDDFVGTMIRSYSDSDLVHFLIADTVSSWPGAIAEKYKLVHVSFCTMPALVFSLLYHLDLLEQNGHLPCKDDIDEEINYVPGVESINTRDLMPLVPFLKESGILARKLHEDFCLTFQRLKKADFILHNTVHELESEVLSALNKYQPNYAIGPIDFSEILGKATVSKSLLSQSDCTKWLDSKAPGSVLYVSFGSFVNVSKKVIEEIAYGLLLSGVNFIWAVRAGIVTPGENNVLPTGYENEIIDKGLIVSWCDQINVLSHPSVGGFLTHNGWNSTLESMWFGVPMMCYPVGWDQPTNRKLVVDDWKIGVSLCDGASIDRNEVAEKIKSFMSEESLKNLSREAAKVKETLHKALEVEGSSERNFDQFVNDLKREVNVAPN